MCSCTNTTEIIFSKKGTNIGTIFWNSQTSQVLVIGSVDKPYNGSPKIQIKADNKIIIDSSKLSAEKISKLVSSKDTQRADNWDGFAHHPEIRFFRSSNTWGKDSFCIDLLSPQSRDSTQTYDMKRRQGINIIIQNGKIRAIRIADHRPTPKEDMIQIKVDNSPWINSRLSRDSCIDLFGNPTEENRFLIQ